MPDADNIGTLSRRWSRMYRKICEGYFPSEVLASDAVNSLVKDIKDYGDAPIRLLKQAASRLESIQNNPLFKEIHDWSEEDYFIRELASTYLQRYKANQRGINIAVTSFKGLIHNIRNGGFISGDIYEMLCKKYIRRVYDGNFVERIPFTGEGNVDLDQNAVNQRLDEISDLVDKNIKSLARRLAQRGNVKRLKSNPHHTLRKSISIDDDVFNIGSNV